MVDHHSGRISGAPAVVCGVVAALVGCAGVTETRQTRVLHARHAPSELRRRPDLDGLRASARFVDGGVEIGVSAQPVCSTEVVEHRVVETTFVRKRGDFFFVEAGTFVVSSALLVTGVALLPNEPKCPAGEDCGGPHFGTGATLTMLSLPVAAATGIATAVDLKRGIDTVEQNPETVAAGLKIMPCSDSSNPARAVALVLPDGSELGAMVRDGSPARIVIDNEIRQRYPAGFLAEVLLDGRPAGQVAVPPSLP